MKKLLSEKIVQRGRDAERKNTLSRNGATVKVDINCPMIDVVFSDGNAFAISPKGLLSILKSKIMFSGSIGKSVVLGNGDSKEKYTTSVLVGDGSLLP